MGVIAKTNAVSISEIMYDPQGSDTGREWVEIFNDTADMLNLTTWKFFESNTNHGISSFSSTVSIPVNGYGIIADNPAKFLIDYPNYNGVLYDSSFSLSNSGELIVLKDGSGSQIDSVNYSPALGGNDDGSTLSLLIASSSWTRGRATPGEENVEELKIAQVTIAPAPMSAPSADIMLLLPEEKIVVAGADSEFSTKAVTNSRKTIDGLNYTWSFGDGGMKVGKSTTYHYSYPGVYTAVVQADNESYIEKGRTRVKVIAPELEIIGNGIGTGGAYVDLKNKGQHELDLSDWILDVNSNFYTLPKNTLAEANSVTRISGNALSFSTSTIESIKNNFNARLLYPDHSVMLRYSEATSSKDFIVATTTTTYSLSKSIVKKSFSQKIQMVSTTTSTSALSTKYQKDTRLIAWFKSLFAR